VTDTAAAFTPPAIPAAFVPPTHDTPDDLAPAVLTTTGERVVTGIEYAKILGFRPLRMDLTVPAGDGPHPVAVYIHGGAWLIGSRRENWVAAPLWRALLDAGIAVASVEYRFSGEVPFPACVNDVSAAVRWLRAYGEALGVRPDAIGVIGESAGGHLTAFLAMNSDDVRITGSSGAAEHSSGVRAAVAWYAPTDFARMDEQRSAPGAQEHGHAGSPESLLVGEAVSTDSEAVRFAGPIAHVSAAAAPLLLIHGADDRAVPAAQSTTLADRLREVGARVELDIVPGADHVFDGVDRGPIIERSVQFLLRELT